ncbi:MAG: SCO family protein [Saprospiraceae bacterium]
MKNIFLFLVAILALTACGSEQSPSDSDPNQPLPVLGNKDVSEQGDTIFHTVPAFALTNQDSQRITNEQFAGKAYVVDFFFTSCPSICPKMQREMLRIYDRYPDQKNLELVSFSIDPRNDTVERLKEYSENLGVSAERWHLLTGDKDEIFALADDFFSIVIEDPEAPGGLDHSGRILLVDPDGKIRAFVSDGTQPEQVDMFFPKIEKLLKEMEG